MSKVVTIPCCMSPFAVTINGVPYTYAAGSVVEVPDEVAAVIENHMNQHMEPEPEEKLTAKVGQTVVVAEVDESGKPTKWQAADLPDGSSGPEIFVVNFDIGYEADGEKTVMVGKSDKSGEEVIAALQADAIVCAKLWSDSDHCICDVHYGGSYDVSMWPQCNVAGLGWDQDTAEDKYTWRTS